MIACELRNDGLWLLPE
jgi:hypothetical protein